MPEGQPMQRFRRLRMKLLKVLFLNGQRSLIERFRLCISALVSIEIRQTGERKGQMGVVSSHGLLPDVQRSLIERFGFCVLALLSVQSGEIFKRVSYNRMLRTQRLLPDGERPLTQRFGLIVPPLVAIQFRQVVECIRRQGIVRTQCLLYDGQRPLIERFGLIVPPLLPAKNPQVIERGGHTGMLRTQRLLPDGERPLIKRFGLHIALVPEEGGQSMEDFGHLRMVRAEHSLADVQRPLKERLSLCVASCALVDIESRLVGKCGKRGGVFDRVGLLQTLQHMGQQSLTPLAGRLLRVRENLRRCGIKRAEDTPAPLLPLRLCHGLQHHRLHQPMDREHLLLGLSLQQRVGTGDANDLIPLQRIAADSLKRFSQVLTSLAKEFFRDGIRL